MKQILTFQFQSNHKLTTNLFSFENSYDPVGGICNWAAGLGCKE